jgi:Uma2 family endonuclease
MEPALRRMTLEEYEAFEEHSDRPHEFRDGFVIAHALASGVHAHICGTLVLAWGAAIRSRRCAFFSENGKVVAPNGDRLIPDFTATCDERDRESARASGEPLLRSPWLVVEILSPSTAADDAIGKARVYRTIPGLTHYVLIDARQRGLMVQERRAGGSFAMLDSLDVLELPDLPALTIDEIYEGTTL